MEATSYSLLRRLQGPSPLASDRERFGKLYHPLICGWVYRMGMPGEAEDIAQDVMLAVSEGLLSRYERRPGTTFRAWLKTITHRRVVDRRRKSKHEIQDPGGVLDEHAAPDPFDDPASDQADRRQLLNGLMRLIRPEFDAQTWQVFQLRVVNGRPVAEVAEATGLTPRAVYLATYNVVNRLRIEVADLVD